MTTVMVKQPESRRQGLPKSTQAGVTATVFARTRGPDRHVTAYPLVRGVGMLREVTKPDEDFTTDYADDVLSQRNWKRTNDWTPLEPGVYVCQAVKV